MMAAGTMYLYPCNENELKAHHGHFAAMAIEGNSHVLHYVVKNLTQFKLTCNLQLLRPVSGSPALRFADSQSTASDPSDARRLATLVLGPAHGTLSLTFHRRNATQKATFNASCLSTVMRNMAINAIQRIAGFQLGMQNSDNSIGMEFLPISCDEPSPRSLAGLAGCIDGGAITCITARKNTKIHCKK